MKEATDRAWLETKTDTAADAASAKMLVSQSETTDYLCQHSSAPLKTTVKTVVTLYRELTQGAATALTSLLVKSGDMNIGGRQGLCVHDTAAEV